MHMGDGGSWRGKLTKKSIQSGGLWPGWIQRPRLRGRGDPIRPLPKHCSQGGG